MKKVLVIVLSALLAISVSACSGTGKSPETSKSANASTPAAEGKKIELKYFSNTPDRTSGQGLAEQSLIDQYMKENPNVKITVETLAPDPQYQDKIKIYNASKNLPDIMKVWGNSNFLTPLVKSDSLASFTGEDFKDMGFVEGSFNGFTVDGKVYGVPAFSDFWFLYYNKKLFTDNGVTVPTNEKELFNAVQKFSDKGIVPISVDARDVWPTALWIESVAQRYSGSYKPSQDLNADDPSWGQAAKHMQDLIKAGGFGKGFLNQDYGMARNLFGQGKAAMYMMGQWEMGMSGDTNFPEEVRKNIGAIPFPALEGGKGKTSDLTAWMGGGFGVSNHSPNKEEAKKFLKWFFKQENWSKFVWQNGITFPAQDYSGFLTGKETDLQNDLTNIFTKATSISGLAISDRLAQDTQKEYFDALQKVEMMAITPEQFQNTMKAILEKAKAQK